MDTHILVVYHIIGFRISDLHTLTPSETIKIYKCTLNTAYKNENFTSNNLVEYIQSICLTTWFDQKHLEYINDILKIIFIKCMFYDCILSLSIHDPCLYWPRSTQGTFITTCTCTSYHCMFSMAL